MSSSLDVIIPFAVPEERPLTEREAQALAEYFEQKPTLIPQKLTGLAPARSRALEVPETVLIEKDNTGLIIVGLLGLFGLLGFFAFLASRRG